MTNKIKMVAMCSVLLLKGLSALAAETAAAGSAAGPAPAAGTLPSCVDAPAKIKAIQDTEGSNKKTQHKYDGFRQALSSDSDEQIVARLVYSEALAANCPSSTNQIMPAIASVIAHRAEAEKNVRQAVFRLNQFASSLNNYSESRYGDFLCPKDQKLWSAAMAAANKALNSDDGFPKNMDGYYFFQHFKTPHPAPDWTKKPSEQFPGSAEFSSCVRFYGSQYVPLAKGH